MLLMTFLTIPLASQSTRILVTDRISHEKAEAYLIHPIYLRRKVALWIIPPHVT